MVAWRLTVFVKLYGSILDSSIWTESLATRIVWITMLAMADRDGEVHATAPGLARRAAVPIQDVEAALTIFEAPDRHSKNPDNEGRRIERSINGYTILNYGHYRELRCADDRRERDRKRKRQQRASKASANVPPCPTVSHDVATCHPIAEAEAYTEAEKEPPLPPKGGRSAEVELDFADWWEAVPRKVGRKTALKAYRAARKRLGPDPLAGDMLSGAAKRWARYMADTARPPTRIEHPSTWLNGDGWENDYEQMTKDELASTKPKIRTIADD